MNHEESKLRDLQLFNQINNFKQKSDLNLKKNNSHSPYTTPNRLRDPLLSPTSKLLKEKKIQSFEKMADENSDKKNLLIENNKNSLKSSLKIKPAAQMIELPALEKGTVDSDEANFKKLESRSQFKQRTQMKRITNILLQSHESQTKDTSSSTLKKIDQAVVRKDKKSLTELEKLLNDKIAPDSPHGNPKANDNAIIKLKIANAIISPSGEGNNPLIERPNNKVHDTILINKNQVEKKETLKPVSFDEFLGSSVDFDQLFYRKTVNIGTKKIDEYYEVMEENPTFKTIEIAPQNTLHYSRANMDKMKKLSMLSNSKYRTLNNDFEDMAQTDFAIERILLRFDKFWLSFPRKQNEETIEEYNEEIFVDYTLFSKGNLFIYSVFNLLVSLLWILILTNLDGFNGFFSTRIIVLSIAVILAEFWTKEFPKKYHKALVLIYYGFIAIQILVFTIINPSVEIVMELEFLACYLSLTRYAFISFVDSILISLIFLVLHIIYLNIIYNGTFLMLHSTFVVIFFNLVEVHIQRKTQIDNFNNSRINIIKKKQLNNLIVNLLPNHVSFIKF